MRERVTVASLDFRPSAVCPRQSSHVFDSHFRTRHHHKTTIRRSRVFYCFLLLNGFKLAVIVKSEVSIHALSFCGINPVLLAGARTVSTPDLLSVTRSRKGSLQGAIVFLVSRKDGVNAEITGRAQQTLGESATESAKSGAEKHSLSGKVAGPEALIGPLPVS